ncbi:NAD-dependent succinate-semialdehyde dehydrogenase [Phenylobacterium hankyongense]|uniref:NAD-dependent succinate-semialdehyde dehydrogenase n=1 Tax=Phenylobacterium hankyongense TaxID=1813876 RepID=A0A328AU44_9CAUL|nr:NAD-dependent succinate-semialdehyde dehydrogenase [Phenylobacterium hankyongense]RAK58553.1 NAD-dependent succinate-semialdehyde dehydrogenase [Phenylobacterium hankyongense]
MDERIPPERDQSRGHEPAPPGGGKPRFTATDPSSGQPGRSYEGHSGDEALEIARRVRAAWPGWRDTPFAERARLMKAAAQVLRRRMDEFAELMTAEMGKTRNEGLAEIEKCAGACDFFADHAEGFLARRPIDMGGPKAFVTFNPLGVVLAVMPWNFPFWQVFRFAAPNLMAGDAAVLKHASSVPGCALAIEDVFREAGFPEDVFRTALIPSRDVRALIEDPSIAAVTLTGSVAAGREVAGAAGGVLKKSVLELGGSDAYLVLEDVDIDKAAGICATARMVNGGQSCIAGKRFIVAAEIREAFERALTEKMRAYQMGDPRDAATKLGPMQSVHARDDIHAQVQKSIAAGARLLTGGEVPDKPGAWYPATVLTDVRPGMPAYDEEVFGPVAAVIEARDEADAIRIANSSRFGLGSGVLTRDLARGERIAAEQLEAGMSFVNANVRSDPRMPFGGVKESGHGRECSEFGIHEFVNIKSVLVQE